MLLCLCIRLGVYYYVLPAPGFRFQVPSRVKACRARLYPSRKSETVHEVLVAIYEAVIHLEPWYPMTSYMISEISFIVMMSYMISCISLV
jgi:hypothetical protein